MSDKIVYVSDSPGAEGVVDFHNGDDVKKQGTGDKLYFNGTGGTLVAGTVVELDLTSTGVDASGNVIDERSVQACSTANSPVYVGVVVDPILTLEWGVVRMHGPVQANVVAALGLGSGVITSAVAGQFSGVAAAVNQRQGYTTTVVVANVATVFLTG